MTSLPAPLHLTNMVQSEHRGYCPTGLLKHSLTECKHSVNAGKQEVSQSIITQSGTTTAAALAATTTATAITTA